MRDDRLANSPAPPGKEVQELGVMPLASDRVPVKEPEDTEDTEDTPESPEDGWRNLIGFWILGLCNNYGYVVMLSAAHDILAHHDPTKHDQAGGYGNVTITDPTKRDCNYMSTGAILLADIIPSLLTKIVAPFFPLCVHVRMFLIIVLSCAGYILVGVSETQTVAIVGVVATAFSSGLGEATLLSYMAFFKNKNVISMWSSGTGGAGFFGSLSYATLTSLGLSPLTTLYVLLVVPLLMSIDYCLLSVCRNVISMWSSGTGGAGFFGSLSYATLTSLGLSPSTTLYVLLVVPLLMSIDYCLLSVCRNVISTWSSGTGGAGFFGSLSYANLTSLGLSPSTTLYVLLVVPLLMSIDYCLLSVCRNVISMWSSGTGGAGFFGSLSYATLTSLGLSPSTTLYVLLVVPLLMSIDYCLLSVCRNVISTWSSGTGGAGFFGSLSYATLTSLGLSPLTTLYVLLVVPLLMSIDYCLLSVCRNVISTWSSGTGGAGFFGSLSYATLTSLGLSPLTTLYVLLVVPLLMSIDYCLLSVCRNVISTWSSGTGGAGFFGSLSYATQTSLGLSPSTTLYVLLVVPLLMSIDYCLLSVCRNVISMWSSGTGGAGFFGSLSYATLTSLGLSPLTTLYVLLVVPLLMSIDYCLLSVCRNVISMWSSGTGGAGFFGSLSYATLTSLGLSPSTTLYVLLVVPLLMSIDYCLLSVCRNVISTWSSGTGGAGFFGSLSYATLTSLGLSPLTTLYVLLVVPLLMSIDYCLLSVCRNVISTWSSVTGGAGFFGSLSYATLTSLGLSPSTTLYVLLVVPLLMSIDYCLLSVCRNVISMWSSGTGGAGFFGSLSYATLTSLGLSPLTTLYVLLVVPLLMSIDYCLLSVCRNVISTWSSGTGGAGFFGSLSYATLTSLGLCPLTTLYVLLVVPLLMSIDYCLLSVCRNVISTWSSGTGGAGFFGSLSYATLTSLGLSPSTTLYVLLVVPLLMYIDYCLLSVCRNVISTWSSGTGGAGFFGSLSYATLTSLGLSPSTTLYVLLVVPLLMSIDYCLLSVCRNVISTWSSGTGGAGFFGSLSYATLTSLGLSPLTTLYVLLVVPLLMSIDYCLLSVCRNVISTWSSGTGGAGFFGSLSYATLTSLGLSPSTTLYVLLVVPLLMSITFWVVLDKPSLGDAGSLSASESNFNSNDQVPLTLSTDTVGQKLRNIPPLFKYMIPLGLVYFFEYFINQGLFELIYFDNIFINHAEQYRWYQVTYQIGVFISRSSINLVKINVIWLLAVLQGLNVIFFTFESLYSFLPNIYVVLAAVLWEGLLGGGAYVNTFYKINKEVAPEKREFSMAITTLADALGITIAGFLSIPVHNYICGLPKSL